jgi:hypothetical protein
VATRIGSAAAKTARSACEDLAERYGLEAGVPANIDARLVALCDVKELVDAETTGSRVVIAMEMQCLGMVADGKASGAVTPESLQAKAKAAESLAKMLDKKEDATGARRQRVRAWELRQQALDLQASGGKKARGRHELKLVREWKSAPTAMFPDGGGLLFEEYA